MFKTALKYGAGLVALYLVVEHATGSGMAIRAAGTQARGLVTGFQGR